MNNEILKVSSKSNPNAVAGAIAGLITENRITSNWSRSNKSNSKGNSNSKGICSTIRN